MSVLLILCVSVQDQLISVSVSGRPDVGNVVDPSHLHGERSPHPSTRGRSLMGSP